MNMNILKMMRKTILVGTGVLVMTVTSCNPEPDESDLYTFTGETIESMIAQDSSLTAFNYILSRVGYDKMMAAYGNYTCFVPTNDGVAAYCDSLYNDSEAVIPHNGMTENSLKGLSDSLCLNIVQYHITPTYRDIVSMTGNGEVSTLLGYEFSFSSDSGETLLGNKATIISSDNVATNGLVHIIDNVIPRFTRFIGDMLERNKETYSIFNEAFHLTGLSDSVLTYTRGNFEYKQLPRAAVSAAISPANGAGTTGTVDCKVGYTVFAESDEVMRANGINDIDDLIAYANEVYGNAPDWYDYMSENGLKVSTGTDYTNRFNALNMFVAYHILGASMSINQLVFEKGSNTYWNYAPDADPYDYFETMLPHTMMKIWEPVSVAGGRTLYINRYRRNNTLTDKLASQGSDAMHEVVEPGVTIMRTGSLQAYNGYVHPINKMLVYNRLVPKGVLNERMRVNCTSLFPELITNRYRYWYTNDGNIASTHDTSRRGIPAKYFKNVTLYDENICFAYCLHGAWRSYQSDQMQFWGSYDLAFKLPSVPSGIYEIRVVYAPMDYGSFMQYYIGSSSSVTSMKALGLPFDARISPTDPVIGLTDAKEEEDMGVATDIAMHNRGYMRGPYSYCGHAESTGWTQANNGRFEYGASMTVRYVLGRVVLNQGDENWLRIKSLDPDNSQAPVGLDFVELCPASVLDNQQYTEDWY
jgi:Secreted and surface protein containing fasciclin-like repeats